MVSNALKMEVPELLKTLERLRRQFSKSADYQELRRELPDDWPM